MLVFFTMGFVDLVGIASNYVKLDLGLTDSEANIFPSLVFFWFLIFSVPTGMLMNKIGRKKTVMLSLVVTFVSLLIPCFGDGYMVMLVSFSLLGIGNALMQTSLNPLLSNIITEDKLASSLTFGQFVKAIASFLAPYIAMAIAIVAILLLGAASIKEEAPEGRPSTFAECIALLGNPFILLMFVGIMCHVGIDVGTNTTAPKILMERLGVDIHAAAFATSLYFIFRTIGCLTGSLVLAHWAAKKFFVVSVVLMVASMAGFLLFDSKVLLYVSIALVGYGNSNVFSILFSQALLSMPQRQNEVSGLMIMGLFGGTVFPLLMGFASDALHSQTGTLLVLVVGVFYLLFLFTKLR